MRNPLVVASKPKGEGRGGLLGPLLRYRCETEETGDDHGNRNQQPIGPLIIGMLKKVRERALTPFLPFLGYEYHAHVDIPGGYEVAWGKSGSRRHPNKFPTEVPKDAKAAVAKVLGVQVDLLEAFKVYDEKIGEDVLFFEVHES